MPGSKQHWKRTLYGIHGYGSKPSLCGMVVHACAYGFNWKLTNIEIPGLGLGWKSQNIEFQGWAWGRNQHMLYSRGRASAGN